MLVDWLSAIALAAWIFVLLMPSRPWSIRERISFANANTCDPEATDLDLARIAVLIPARNEAPQIGATLAGLAAQGINLQVVVIDDQSDDGTASAAQDIVARLDRRLALSVVDGEPLPAGWGGKLWALEQGLERVEREFCLLLDAEIVLEPGVIGALLAKAEIEGRALVSIMAKLRCDTFWEHLLVPPFIFFFKLLYPFAKVNAPTQRTAAAAGGCILVRTEVLREIGGFAALRDALIDDCALATRIKQSGHSIWLGLSEHVTSTRAYPDFASFRRMVTRTAFTQLQYSASVLVLVCLLMLVLFLAPIVSLAMRTGAWGMLAGAGAVIAMSGAYRPTVRFYRLGWFWVLTLPVAALLFLFMTLESALNYWLGVKAQWKGRTYAARS